MKLLIPVAFGLEAVVKRQLKKLGYCHAPATNGRIAVEGDWTDVARLNLWLRSGERVLIELTSFHAETFDALYDAVQGICWEEWMTPHSRILLDGKSYKSTLAAIKASGGVIKKAIVDRLTRKFRLTTLPEDRERFTVGFSIYENEVSVTLDTTGDSLHKRGYRTLAYTAPLKETLAAALIDMTYYFPERAFADPMCGSGTLPVEAAIKSLNIAPGRNRDFDFLHWPCADKAAFAAAKSDALDLEIRDARLDIFAGDINEKAVSIARYHAKQAGVEKQIRFKVADLRNFTSARDHGVLITNPPYGERLEDEASVRETYKALGQMTKALPDWNVYILSGCPAFERAFGRRADKTHKVYNANIECGFYCYPSKT
ncbi:MAG: class I SAM-dependent RNA methyltransferase [Clostridia bacterium]|nr:class I SAM-dependent RNA methyltransferase [Clostridia bacterium]